MTLPNFLVVGTAKAGTTALYDYLGQHPQIFVNPEKETNFFAFEGESLNFTGPGDSWNTTVITDLQDYEKQFDGVRNESAIGESCPWYLYSEKAAENILHHAPGMKIVIILRDPVERAYSSYLHVLRDGREKLSFVDGLAEEGTRISEGWEYIWHYRSAGMYSSQVERYMRNFPPEQLKVFLYEEFRENEQRVLAELHEFLGVRPFEADLSINPSATGVPRSKLLGKLFLQENSLRDKAKYFMPKKLRHGLYHKINQQLVRKPKLEADTRRLLAAGFEEEIEKLEKLLSRDLSAWRRDSLISSP